MFLYIGAKSNKSFYKIRESVGEMIVLTSFNFLFLRKKRTLALIKSISGIRGTIGGKAGDNLTPQDIVESTAAFGTWLLEKGYNPKVVIGRDARISGGLVSQLATQTLLAMGIDVLDLGLSTTPTVEMAVPHLGAGAGIILTASHNPKNWNALKLLNNKGEFISGEDGQRLLDIIAAGKVEYADVDQLGQYQQLPRYLGMAYLHDPGNASSRPRPGKK